MTIDDDGVQVATGRPGLGTRMMNETAIASSTATLADGRRRLAAVIPVVAADRSWATT